MSQLTLVNKSDKERVIEALDHVDEDVEPTLPRRSVSLAQQVRELSPGDSLGKLRPIESFHPIATLLDLLPAMRQDLRNDCAPSIRQAKGLTGGDYRLEVIDLKTATGFYLLAVIKRIR